MRRWFSFRWLALGVLASLLSLSLARVSVAEASSLATLPLPLPWIQKKALTLSNGDAADVYYPQTPSLSAFVDAFPVVAVLQGAQVDKIRYERFCAQLARHGFVVVIANHYRTLAPGAPPLLFTSRTVITNVLAQMRIEDADPQSSLYRIVDTETLALAGHSFGGVVGLFASAAVDVCSGPVVPPFLLPFCDGQYKRPKALRAAAFYGTSLVQNGSLLLDLDTSGVATALIQGSRDGSSLPGDAALTYPTLESPRALFGVNGANHYGISDENNPPGAIPDLTPPTLSQYTAGTHVAHWTGLWLRAHLKNDRAAKFSLYELFNEVVSVETD